MQIADRPRADHIPADAIYLDIDYQKNNRPFTVDPDKFPHFTQMIQDLAQKDLHVVAITDLHIAKLPNSEDAPYAHGPRRSYAGGQPYAATWTGDNSSTWNHLRMTVPQLINLGLSGFVLSGADVGGFAGSPPADLPTRWIERAAFQPIDRDHSAKGTRMHEVWFDGPEQEAIRRRYIEERYRLGPLSLSCDG